ncbi:MAG: hypothetical protein HY343_09630 [Lentisphaerae bacterium]|nr:hypothetical protein [Lentisphaerota bacterium]
MSTTATGLRAGVGVGDITPALGIQLAGDIGRLRPTEEIRDRLFARALALDKDGKRCCWVSLDLLAMSTEWSTEIRRRIHERFALAPEAVFLHCVQNHSSPTLGHFFTEGPSALVPPEYPWLLGGDDRYNEPAVAAILSAVDKALAELKPVTVAVGRGIDGRVAFNRRFVMRDGTARCHPPGCSPDILHVEGPTDPEVGVMTLQPCESLEAPDGPAGASPLAMLLHHTCHPTHGYPHRYVIGDWPGAWVEEMQSRVGPGGMPMVLNGCCGNIHHFNHIDPDSKGDYRRMARQLAETSGKALAAMTPLADPVLDWRRSVLQIPLRKLKVSQLRADEKLIRENPQPMWKDAGHTAVEWEWVYAVSRLSMKESQKQKKHFDYEIQAFRLGDMALVTLMGEPFVEAQLEIKLKSPAKFTWVAHFANGYVGYVPTRRAFKGGGFETRTGIGSKLCEDALERITAESLSLLKQLFP